MMKIKHSYLETFGLAFAVFFGWYFLILLPLFFLINLTMGEGASVVHEKWIKLLAFCVVFIILISKKGTFVRDLFDFKKIHHRVLTFFVILFFLFYFLS